MSPEAEPRTSVPLFPRNEHPPSNVLIWFQVEIDGKTEWRIGGFDADSKEVSWFSIGQLHPDRQRIVLHKKQFYWDFAVGYWTWFKPLDIPPQEV